MPDGRSLVTSGVDGTLRFWRAATRAEAEPKVMLTLHHRQAEQAERTGQWADLIAHLDRLVAADPTDMVLRQRRVRAHAQLAQWRQAAADYRVIVAAQPDDRDHWFRLALTQLAGGDTPAYRKTCADMFRRFHMTDLNNVVWISAVGPDAVPDLEVPIRQMEKAVAHEPRNAALRNTLSAAYYRAGEYAKALEQLKQILALQGKDVSSTDRLFLAMTCARLGRMSEARQWFSQAEAPPTDRRTRADILWQERLIYSLLYREAQTVVR
jgi:tetratricopeptide (TPR) repeat protein